MSTEWQWAVAVIAENESIGNFLAGKIGPDVGDNLTFTNGKAIRKMANHSQTAKFAYVLLKQSGYDYVVEFTTAGPYPGLNALGIDDATVAMGKAAVKVDVGLRDDVASRWQAFLAEHGYEVVPDQ